MRINLLLIFLIFFWCEVTAQDVTELDKLAPLYRVLQERLLETFQPPNRNARTLQRAEQSHRLQPQISPEVPFPCPVKHARSKNSPESVHKLRPGDISVIGALGDSLTAGNGLLASNFLDILLQNRGASFDIGGEGTWRKYVTLANILKEFNPNLIGYSKRSSSGHERHVSQFNLAEPGGMSRDMPYSAKKLVNRIKEDPRIDFHKDWKMVSILIGGNDFCADVCYRHNLEATVASHRNDMLKTLRVLRDHLPRTIVNIVVVPHLKVLAEVILSNRPPQCYFSHNFVCPCLFGLQFAHLKADIYRIMSEWQEVDIAVADEPEFDRDDFTVVAQPFCKNYFLHGLKNGLTDYSVLSEDCFHLSQKEDARAAISLWNNILEPVGKKTPHPIDLFNFRCPTKDSPYIFTRRNSG